MDARYTYYLVNVDSDSWSMTWFSTGSGETYRQYEFDLNVTDTSGTPIQNANVTVKHYGQTEAQDFSVLTGANGSFSTQTLTMGFYNQTGGDTIYSYNPHNLTVTASGYRTYTANITLNDKTDWTITLETPAAAETTEAEEQPSAGSTEFPPQTATAEQIGTFSIFVFGVFLGFLPHVFQNWKKWKSQQTTYFKRHKRIVRDQLGRKKWED